MGMLRDLSKRRVPQILGIYLGAGWIIIEFVDWLVARYLLSSTLVDLVLVALLSLTPAVLLVGYFHGTPGKDRWETVEKVGVPVNIMFTAVLLFTLFQGKDLGATVATVTVTDEQGAVVERTLAKQRFRQRVALFFFDHDGPDRDLDWWQYGFTMALAADLEQDPFMELWSPYIGYEQRGFFLLRRAGFDDGLDVPLALKREIALKGRLDRFIAGRFSHDDGLFEVTATLHNSATGKAESDYAVSGSDPFAVVDELTLRIKESLAVPDSQAFAGDLPVADRLTRSMEAFELYVKAHNARDMENDLDAAIGYWRVAVGLDAGFALANLHLATTLADRGILDEAAEATEGALRHSYKLVDDEEFLLKGVDYSLRRESAKRTALFEMWAELYPENTDAHAYLGFTYLYQDNDLDAALATLRKIPEIDPNEDWVLREVGQLLQIRGDFQGALEYYRRFARKREGDLNVLLELGDLHRRLGQFEEARSEYERAGFASTGYVDPPLRLADLALRVGDFAAAEKHLEEAADLVAVPRQEGALLRGRIGYAAARGRVGEAANLVQKLYEVESQFRRPINLVMTTYVTYAPLYAKADRVEEGREAMVRLAQDFGPPFDELVQVGYMFLAVETGDTEAAEHHTKRVGDFLDNFKNETHRYNTHWALGRIAELEGDFDRAIGELERAHESLAGSMQWVDSELDVFAIQLDLARVLRKAGRAGDAERTLSELLTGFPAHPEANLEMARLLTAIGRPAEAEPHLLKALDAWEGADPQYGPPIKARVMLAELALGTGAG